MASEKKQEVHAWSRDRGQHKHNSLSQSPDLAKLNPNCHMKYSNYL